MYSLKSNLYGSPNRLSGEQPVPTASVFLREGPPETQVPLVFSGPGCKWKHLAPTINYSAPVMPYCTRGPPPLPGHRVSHKGAFSLGGVCTVISSGVEIRFHARSSSPRVGNVFLLGSYCKCSGDPVESASSFMCGDLVLLLSMTASKELQISPLLKKKSKRNEHPWIFRYLGISLSKNVNNFSCLKYLS